jgi:two-component system phosphate regulon sensor histidine kinase PhoR
MINKRFYLLLLSFAAIFAILFLSFFLRNANLYMQQARENGLKMIDMIFLSLSPDEERDYRDFQRIAIENSRLINARVIMTSEDSILLADSGRQNVSGLYYDSVLSEAKKGESTSKVFRNRTEDSLLLSVARPAVLLGKEFVLIELVFEISEVSQIFRIILQTSLGLILLLSAVALTLMNYFRKQVKVQIKMLLKSTELALENGGNTISVQSSSEEFEKLIGHFNVLLGRYNNLIYADNKKYSRINTIFSSIGSGIISVDSENRISMVNPQAEILLQIDKIDLFSSRPSKKKMNEYLSSILEHTERVNQTRIDERFSIRTEEGSILDVSVNVINNKYVPYDHFGVLAVIVDVTEIRRLESLRSEFVSNVSHELRTPLTLISGFVETLKSWQILSEKDRNRSLDIIEIETDRLKRLISELLLLSKIENQIVRKYEADIDVKMLVLDVVSSLKPFSLKKGITMTVTIEENIPPIKGVDSWFRQMIHNLCENAIKYTPDHGHISVDVSKEKGTLMIKVQDDGIGIPFKDQDKIFERFYRVDKSRNSRIGGSGLGLAIARHISNELGGDISLSSAEGEGSEFIVTLPLNLKK